MDQHHDLENKLKEFESIFDSYWPYVIALVVAIITTFRSYMCGPQCPSNERIDNKIVVITGASSGIGKETALELAKRGGIIILAVKNVIAGAKVADRIRKIVPDAKIFVRNIDLSCLESVCDFASNLDVEKIDILINNAGIVFHPFEKTKDGFELHFVTNYLGHFLLTLLLLPKLKQSEQGRIINVSAQAHAESKINFDDLNLEKKFSAMKCFGQSKLALILMGRYMSNALRDSKITINSVDPGLVRGTQHLRRSFLNSTFLIKLFMQPFMWLLLKNPLQGAQTTIYAAVANKLNCESGLYLRDCEITSPAENAKNDQVAKKLFEKSIELLKPHLVTKDIDLKSFFQ